MDSDIYTLIGVLLARPAFDFDGDTLQFRELGLIEHEQRRKRGA